MKRVALLFVALFALLASATAVAQDSPIHIYVGAPGRNKVPIALPKPIGDHEKGGHQ